MKNSQPRSTRRGPSGRLLLALGAIALLAVVGAVVLVSQQRNVPPTLALNELALKIQAGEIARIDVKGARGVAESHGGEVWTFGTEVGQGLPQVLGSYGVTAPQLQAVRYTVGEGSEVNWAGLIFFAIMSSALVAAVVLTLRRRGSGGDVPFGFARSRAKLFVGAHQNVTFDDVAGVEEAKQELQEVVEFLKYPEKFTVVGARIPKGVLLVGPPGTGKTLLARAVAGEAGVPFFSVSGSEFVEMFVGVGASRARDLFAQAKRTAPCIVFIDEIDAIGRKRGVSMGGGNDEREQTLNQILVEMDGFDGNTNVIVVAATNRADVLDPALLRPGRFDRQVMVQNPDLQGRRAILRVHAQGKPLEEKVDLGVLAKQTTGFSGADLANLVNEGAILAARRNSRSISMLDLQGAIDRVIAGPESKSRVMSNWEKSLTAYHEAGHAVVGRFSQHHDPVHKITIVPHGHAGGYTRFLPEEDRHYMVRTQFEAMLASALGGYAAEQIVFGQMSTGASNDIQKATEIARRMVTEYGMAERLGPIALSHVESRSPLGGQLPGYSEAVAKVIDEEVQRLLQAGYQQATDVIQQHRNVLERVALELIRVEVLEGDDLERVFVGDVALPVADAAVAMDQEVGRVEAPAGKSSDARPVPPRLSRAPGLASETVHEQQ